MALTNQPYLPLYVKDWLTNNKLKLCSPGAHGLLINIMCVLHKEDSYGRILLNQKFKQSDKQIKNFASMFAKLLPFSEAEIERYLEELVSEKVLYIDDHYLYCDRMERDALLSKTRSATGKLGGDKTAKRLKNFA